MVIAENIVHIANAAISSAYNASFFNLVGPNYVCSVRSCTIGLPSKTVGLLTEAAVIATASPVA